MPLCTHPLLHITTQLKLRLEWTSPVVRSQPSCYPMILPLHAIQTGNTPLRVISNKNSSLCISSNGMSFSHMLLHVYSCIVLDLPNPNFPYVFFLFHSFHFLFRRFIGGICGTTLLQASERVRKKNVEGTNDCLIITYYIHY